MSSYRDLFRKKINIPSNDYYHQTLLNQFKSDALLVGRNPRVGIASRPVFGQEWGPVRYLLRFSQSNHPSTNVLLMEHGAMASQASKIIARQCVPSTSIQLASKLSNKSKCICLCTKIDTKFAWS